MRPSTRWPPISRAWSSLLPLALLLAPAPLLAHGPVPTGPDDLWSHWSIRPQIALPLLLAGALYARGLQRAWRRGGTGRIIPFWRGAAFALGLLVLALALLSPLDPLGEVLFSAHMGQHLLLILVAPPLLVAGAPELAFLWALPGRWRGWIGRTVGRTNGWIPGGRDGMRAPFAVVVATAWLWAWHLPRLYDWAVRNELAHAAEHAGFLGTALLFWAVVLHVRPRDRAGNGLRMLSVFATAVQGSALGALITFAGRPLYRSHAMISTAWGLTPLADQQLAGLLMWVPPAVLYLGVGAHLFVGWLDAAGARARETAGVASSATGEERGDTRGGVTAPSLPSR